MPLPLLLLLSAYLAVWVPLGFAAELTSVLPSLGVRGPMAIAELLLHGASAAFCVAAAVALWSGGVDALRLAACAVAFATATTIQSLYVSVLPSQTQPGQHLPLAVLAGLHGAAWLWYLRRRARASR